MSLGADLGRELVDCIPGTSLHCLSAVVYGDVLMFISLGLMWPGLRAPSESKQEGSGMEVHFQTCLPLGAVYSHDGLGPIYPRNIKVDLFVFRAPPFPLRKI